MSLKNYIVLMLFATATCCLTWLAVVFFFAPSSAGAVFFFYLSLFLSLFGIFSLLGLFVRLFFVKNNLVFRLVTVSFRQAIWFSLLIIACLYLNHSKLFSWPYVILLIIALSLFELFFISYKTKPKGI